MHSDLNSRRTYITSMILALSGFGCYCVDVPYPQQSLRAAPICTGASNPTERRAIDDFEAAIAETNAVLVCDDAMESAFAASGVDRFNGRDGQYFAVHPWVAVSMYQWNAEGTALELSAYSEAPRELNPCGDQAWRGTWGLWRSDGRVAVVFECGDPNPPPPQVRYLVDPFADTWEIDERSGPRSTRDIGGALRANLVEDGQVRAADGNRYPVTLGWVTRLTERYAVGAPTPPSYFDYEVDRREYALQNLRTGVIFGFEPPVFISPSGQRLASGGDPLFHNSPPYAFSALPPKRPIRLYDISGDAPVELMFLDVPRGTDQWSIQGFAGDRLLTVIITRTTQFCSYGFFGHPRTSDRVFMDTSSGELFDPVADSASSEPELFPRRVNP
jgi:hypothetical protein